MKWSFILPDKSRHVYFEESGAMTDEEMPSLDLTCFTQATFSQLPLQKFTSPALSLLSLHPLCPRTVPFSPVSWSCCWTNLPRTFLSFAFQLPTALSSFYFKMLMQQLWARWGLLILEDFNQAVLSPCFLPCGKSAVFSKIPPHCQEFHPGLRDTRAYYFPLWWVLLFILPLCLFHISPLTLSQLWNSGPLLNLYFLFWMSQLIYSTISDCFLLSNMWNSCEYVLSTSFVPGTVMPGTF